jgi:hypothetical protein
MKTVTRKIYVLLLRADIGGYGPLSAGDEVNDAQVPKDTLTQLEKEKIVAFVRTEKQQGTDWVPVAETEPEAEPEAEAPKADPPVDKKAPSGSLTHDQKL